MSSRIHQPPLANYKKPCIVYFQSSSICIGLTIYSIVVVEAQLVTLLETPESFADFTSLGDTIKDIFSCISFTVFFAWIKVFKYISFNKTMSQLPTTLQRVTHIHHFIADLILIWIDETFSVCCWSGWLFCHVCNCIHCFCSARLFDIWNSSMYLCIIF